MSQSPSSTVLSSTKEAVLTILSWAKESSDVFPPLKSAVGCALFIAEAIDKFRRNKQEWRELALYIAKEISSLNDKLSGLDMTQLENHSGLKDEVQALTTELESIQEVIEKLLTRSRFERLIQARSDLEKIAGFRAQIVSCMSRFLVRTNIEILHGVGGLGRHSMAPTAAASLQPDFTIFAPEKPRIFHGREEELKTILSFIESGVNASNPARVAICGSGGIGKTSLALSILHHDETKARFGSRCYFVSCEAADTSSLLLSTINRALGVAQGSSDPLLLLRSYIPSLGVPTILLLDNFETPWESDDRDQVQQILTVLDSSSHLSLLVTTRVTMLPDGIFWAKFPPLRPFSLDAARRTFHDITREEPDAKDSVELDEVLLKLDLVPLAVKLMASMAQLGESIAGLRQAWERERTSMLAAGSSSKTSNIEVSIKISLNSRTVQAIPDAIRLLSLLCLLPDGAERSSLDRMTTISQPDSAVRILKAVGLIYEEYSRLRVLSPIREYIRHRSDLPIHEDDTKTVTKHYTNLAGKGVVLVEDEGFIPACQILPPERGNIHSIISLEISKGPPSSLFAMVLYNYTWFLISTAPSPDLLEQMVKIEDWGRHLGARLQANIRICLAEAYCVTGALDQARRQLELAREYSVTEGLPFEAASALRLLGQTLANQGEPIKAMDYIRAAKEGFASIGNLNARLGEVLCMVDLGQCLSRNSQYEEAREELLRASELLKTKFPERRHRLANALCHLAHTNCGLGELDSAISLIEESLTIVRKLGSTQGQGYALLTLGKILIKKGEYEHSIRVLEESIPLLSSSGQHAEAINARHSLEEAYRLLNEGSNIIAGCI